MTHKAFRKLTLVEFYCFVTDQSKLSVWCSQQRMLPAFLTSCCELISRWEKSVGSEGSCELDVWPEFQNFTGDVISRTAFGSSYKQGMRIFQLQTEQARLIIKSVKSMVIPCYRYISCQY